MIKSLFGEDDDIKKEQSQPELIQEVKEQTISNSFDDSANKTEALNDISKSEIDTQKDVISEEDIRTEDNIETIDEIKTAIETGIIPPRKDDSVRPFEINRPIRQPTFERKMERDFLISNVPEEIPAKSERELELEKKLAEIEQELLDEKEYQINASESAEINEAEKKEKERELENTVNQSPDLFSKKSVERSENKIKTENVQQVKIAPKDFKPTSKTEAIKNSGLAYSAAIALFGSVVFMMVLGWFADQMLDSFPWGITTGIVVGAIIGFVQFFRLTSQIINPKPNDFERVSINSSFESPKKFETVQTITENQSVDESNVTPKLEDLNK